MSEIPQAIIGRFRLVERLGKGGFGEVHRAFDPHLQREVAIKIVRPDRADRARVLAEARAAAGLQHPNIVTVYEVGEADDTFFIVMELVQGQVLGSACATAPVARKLEWLEQLARALAAAHARGIVHRDVKPENAIVASSTQALKLLDFGIAKRVVQPLSQGSAVPNTTHLSAPPTLDGHVKGTPRYLAPEQLLGEPVTFATDQWAWGVVAYQALSGSHPAVVAEGEAKISWAVAGSLVPLDRVARDLPANVVATVQRALSKDPRARFSSMDELVATLSGGGGGGARIGDTRVSAPMDPGRPSAQAERGETLADPGRVETQAFDLAVSAASPHAAAPARGHAPVHPAPARISHPQPRPPSPMMPSPRTQRAMAPRPGAAASGGSALSFVAIVVVAVLVVVAAGILAIGCLVVFGRR